MLRLLVRREYKRMGLDYIELGLIGQLVGAVLLTCALWSSDRSPLRLAAAEALIALSTAVLMAGCGQFAVYRQRSRWWGLLGIASFAGTILVVVITTSGSIDRDYRRGFSVLHGPPASQRDVWKMDVRVKLDASMGLHVHEAIHLQLPRGASISVATKTIANAIPQLWERMPAAICSINGEPAGRGDELSDGDELTIYAGTPATEHRTAHIT